MVYIYYTWTHVYKHIYQCIYAHRIQANVPSARIHFAITQTRAPHAMSASLAGAQIERRCLARIRVCGVLVHKRKDRARARAGQSHVPHMRADTSFGDDEARVRAQSAGASTGAHCCSRERPTAGRKTRGNTIAIRVRFVAD